VPGAHAGRCEPADHDGGAHLCGPAGSARLPAVLRAAAFSLRRVCRLWRAARVHRSMDGYHAEREYPDRGGLAVSRVRAPELRVDRVAPPAVAPSALCVRLRVLDRADRSRDSYCARACVWIRLGTSNGRGDLADADQRYLRRDGDSCDALSV